jgi:hypothetical protein
MKLALVIAFGTVAALAACGGKAKPPAQPDDDLTIQPGSGKASGAATPDTPIHQRRDAACEQLGPRLTECAIEDAKKNHHEEALKDIDKVAPLNTKKFIEACEGSEMSSRQVRVLEVCFKEAPDCDGLDECLKNLTPQAGEK